MKAQEIILIVCDYYHVGSNYLDTNKRNGDIIKIKHLAVYFIITYLRLSLAATGRYFRGKNDVYDHASVLHAVKSVEAQRDTNTQYRKELEEIDEIIRYKNRYEYIDDDDVFDYQLNDMFKN